MRASVQQNVLRTPRNANSFFCHGWYSSFPVKTSAVEKSRNREVEKSRSAHLFRHFGPGARNAVSPWFCAPRPLNFLTARLFDLLLCFHRHSPIVLPSSCTADRRVCEPPHRPWESRRPQSRRSARPDFLYLSFVFKDIRALFRRYRSRGVEKSRSREANRCLPDCAEGLSRLLHSLLDSSTPEIPDFLTSPFVFIDIRALLCHFS